MPRNVSLWLLVGMVCAIGVLFFQVVRPFLLAVFVAVVLAVLFAPLHQWITDRLGGRRRIAAIVTTTLVLTGVLLPIAGTLLMAGNQAMQVSTKVADWLEDGSSETLHETLQKIRDTTVGGRIQEAYMQLSENQKEGLRNSATRFSDGMTAEMYEKTRGLLSDAFTFVIGFGIMTLGLYYCLADRTIFLREIHRMIPLKDREEEQLTARFQSVCRGVVMGTVVAGIVQASLSGIAYAVIGVPQLWMLIVLTMFFSFIPFLGPATVWLSVAAYLLLNERYMAAIGLVVYGTAIVSTSDNLVRAYVIGNQARLHPLVALVTVLGALKMIGLWGIFVGPMVAAFFYALLNIIRDRFVEGVPAESADTSPDSSENLPEATEPRDSQPLQPVKSG